MIEEGQGIEDLKLVWEVEAEAYTDLREEFSRVLHQLTPT